MHENLSTCVIFGHKADVQVHGESERVSGRIVCIKPDVMHGVVVPEGGADVLYLDGVKLPSDYADFSSLDNAWADIPEAFHCADKKRFLELRRALDSDFSSNDQKILAVIERLYVHPLERMSQEELAQHLGMERTQALKLFKRVTGQTFRRFKKWAASVTVTSSVFNDGLIIGHAGLDAGFSDAAHTSRTAREVFGLTPTDGVNSLKGISTLLA